MSLTIAITTGFIFLLLGYLLVNIKKHYLLQILFFFMISSLLLLASKNAIDDNNSCEWLLTSQTTINNITTNDYTYTCYENDYNTANVFYKFSLWFFRLVSIYLFVFITYKVFMMIKDKMKKYFY